MASIFDKILRAGEGKILAKLKILTKAVNSLESEFQQLSDEELKNDKGAIQFGIDKTLPKTLVRKLIRTRIRLLREANN